MSLHDVPSGSPARVPTPLPNDPRLARLSLNQRTTAAWSLREAVDGCVRAGVPSIGLWREPVAEVGLEVAASWVREAGLRVSSLCRGGFMTDPDHADAAHEDNVRAIEEARVLGAPTLVLVPGGVPRGEHGLDAARDRVVTAIERLVPHARDAGVRLGIEPMHPMYAADRGVVSTLAQALDIAERYPTDVVGVVVDTFHLWWEPGLGEQIERAGDRIVSYQVGDWITPMAADSLLSRGMMGDGHIDFAAFTTSVADAGYRGDIEVEIFNQQVWDAPGGEVVATMLRRYVEVIEPHL
jgi:sugar phosphate isomerase/epimerase